MRIPISFECLFNTDQVEADTINRAPHTIFLTFFRPNDPSSHHRVFLFSTRNYKYFFYLQPVFLSTYPVRSTDWAMIISLHPPCYPLSLTLTVPPVWQQLVAAWARAVVRAWDVHTLVDAQLPSLVQPVHFTLIYICDEITGSVDVCLTYASQDQAEQLSKYSGSKSLRYNGTIYSEERKNAASFSQVVACLWLTFWASLTSTYVEQLFNNSSLKMLLN